MYILSSEEIEWIDNNSTKFKNSKELYNEFYKVFGRLTFESFMNARHQFDCPKMNKYTKEQEEFLIQHYQEYSLDRLAIEFQRKFGGEKKKNNALSAKCKNLGLSKETKKYNNQKLLDFIEKNYNVFSPKEISKLVKEKFGVEVSEGNIKYIVQRYGLNVKKYVPRSKASPEIKEWLRLNYASYSSCDEVRVIINNLFDKDFTTKEIQDIANKQVKVKMVESSQFEKGKKPHNSLPVGTIRKDKDTYSIKIRDGFVGKKSRENWMNIDRYYYELYHDIKLTKYDVVICLDNNPLNVKKENLVMVSNSAFLSIRSFVKRNPEVLGNVELMKALVKTGSLKSVIKKVLKK